MLHIIATNTDKQGYSLHGGLSFGEIFGI